MCSAKKNLHSVDIFHSAAQYFTNEVGLIWKKLEAIIANLT